ncbi:lactoylglutathione lyase [Siculibacillus lacustris]|uniref:Lactoylglutathione lyase n=1 Tax=Siculibacillus lacustris TaxID=1549641 RepID=A0A4Q9VFJ7_9HYPH|nr:VOC family protein [Siculibacillus lacustris]TBW33701.1 lactoylglutathione lyase [Siculibacillus lacustris]
MRFLHTMVRVRNLAESLAFYTTHLGLVELRRIESEKGRFTLVYLVAPDDRAEAEADLAAGRRDAPSLELTWNWDDEELTGARNFGHLAYEVDDIHATCARLMAAGIVIARPPRDGNMAFVRSPDGISIEFLQKGAPLTPAEPWLSMPNTGTW